MLSFQFNHVDTSLQQLSKEVFSLNRGLSSDSQATISDNFLLERSFTQVTHNTDNGDGFFDAELGICSCFCKLTKQPQHHPPTVCFGTCCKGKKTLQNALWKF